MRTEQDEAPLLGQPASWNLRSQITMESAINAVPALLEVIRDVSEEHVFLYALMDSLPFAIYFKDADSRFRKINKEFARRLGLAVPEEAIGKTDFDFFNAQHAMEAMEDERRILSTGAPLLEKEEKETWPDGTERWAVTTKMPLTGPDGALIGTFGVSRDVTEWKRSEDASRFLGSLVEASDDAIIGLDTSGRVMSWNRGAESLYGYTAAEVIGNPNLFVITPDQKKEPSQIVEDIAKGERLRFESKHLAKDKRSVEVSVTVSPIRDCRGELTGAVMVAHDITERKRMEADLRNSQKLESIGQLAAGIAHEINTPIQYVGDNTRFLGTAFAAIHRVVAKHRAFTEQVKENVEYVVDVDGLRALEETEDLVYLIDEVPKAIEQSAEGIKKVANIVRAMKEFSHPHSSQKELTDLNHAIENTTAVCRNEWKYVAEIETALDPTLPAVFCLAGEINQVILSLVVNAAHAIGSAKKGIGQRGVIGISTREDSGWAEIRVEDNGTGISEALKPHIFTPFFTTKEVGQGTGQGLYLARTILVKKHGGTLTFESTDGVGTVFIARIPLHAGGSLATTEEKVA